MMKKTIREMLPALLVLGAAVLIASCSPGFGVFREIQTETAQVGTDLFKNASVKTLGEDGTNYYAVMAKVFYRPKSGGQWQVLPVNGDSDYLCGGFTSDGTSIWVAALETGSTAALKGIYQGTVGGTSWTSVDASAFGTQTIDALFWAGTDLFALTHIGTTPKYSLYNSTGGTGVFAATGLTGLDDPILGIVWNGAYWAATRTKAYTGTAAALTTDATPPGGKFFGGLAVDSSNKVFVTTTDGYVYTNNGAWSAAAEVDSGVSLGALIEVPVNGGSAAPYRFIVAKKDSSYGYFEYNVGSSPAIIGNASGAVFAPTASSYTTTVYQKPVQAIHYSSAESTILIGLSAQGTSTYALYKNKYSSSGGWSGWTAE